MSNVNVNVNNTRLPEDEIVLSARGICKSYRQGRSNYDVLNEVDFQVRRGEFVAIAGSSGSGKSTLMHILGLMARPTRAESLVIDGVETSRLSQGGRTAIRRDKIGFVFQRFNLLTVLSARDNLALALKLRRQPVDGQIDRLLDFVGLADRRSLRPGQMSIGEQQRLAFARAIIHRPAILLADEPTGNLDAQNAEKLMQLIQRARGEFNQTIIMVTHNPALAELADRKCVMTDGRLTDGKV